MKDAFTKASFNVRKKDKNFFKNLLTNPYQCVIIYTTKGTQEVNNMEKSIRIGKNWEFGIWWREDWKFIGFVELFGFGKYHGITFKKY